MEATSSRSRSPLLIAALLLVMTVGVAAVPLPASAQASCAKHWTEQSSSNTYPFQAWVIATGSYQTVTASWGTTEASGATGPCSHIYLRNNTWAQNSRTAYRSVTLDQWVHGAAGWVWGPKDQYVITITSLANGTLLRPGVFNASSMITTSS